MEVYSQSLVSLLFQNYDLRQDRSPPHVGRKQRLHRRTRQVTQRQRDPACSMEAVCLLLLYPAHGHHSDRTKNGKRSRRYRNHECAGIFIVVLLSLKQRARLLLRELSSCRSILDSITPTAAETIPAAEPNPLIDTISIPTWPVDKYPELSKYVCSFRVCSYQQSF